MVIKKFGDKKVVDWKPLKGKVFITENDLAEAIASSFLKEEQYVFVSFAGLYETEANNDKSNLLVDKVYHTLWRISGEHYLLCVSEKNSALVSVDVCWIGDACIEKCEIPGICHLVKMLPISLGGTLYLKNELI